MRRIVIFILLAMITLSCDVPQRITMVNKSDYDVIVEMGNLPRMSADNNSGTINVTLTQEEAEKYFIGGFIGWQTKKDVFSRYPVESVMMLNQNDTIVIKDSLNLESVVTKRVWGLRKSHLKIKIKNGS
jgi:hypothetical protein